mmetsp:Transcript_61434/g.102243  ORF Transcript_61434/g.102243 Transcript_61434/m.102243 type:complete len:242 (+) Transcript_61434:480-1205(+)
MLRHSSPDNLPSSPSVACGFASRSSALFPLTKCMYAFLAALGSPAAARSAAARFLLTRPLAVAAFGARRWRGGCLSLRGAALRPVRPTSSSSPSSLAASGSSALKSASATSSPPPSSSEASSPALSSLLSWSAPEASASPARVASFCSSPSPSCALLSSLVSSLMAPCSSCTLLLSSSPPAADSCSSSSSAVSVGFAIASCASATAVLYFFGTFGLRPPNGLSHQPFSTPSPHSLRRSTTM